VYVYILSVYISYIKGPSLPTAASLYIAMSSAAAQYPDATPNPPVFKPKNNPAFILHGKLSTSFEEVGESCRGCELG
jgi:hypothetical protein